MNRIAQVLKAQGVRPAQAAARLSVSRGHLGDLISGRREPSPELALAIEREFGINAALLNRTVAAIRQARA